jgi:hypothetical protein
MTKRLALRSLALAAMALLLASCFKVDMNLDVSQDNTVSGSAVIAVDKQLVALSGQNVDDLFKNADPTNLPPGASIAPYDDGDFVGQEITFDSVPLEKFSGANDPLTGAGEELSITRQGDEFHVSGNLDMSGREFTGNDQIPQPILDSFEFVISITFPGEVKSATGEIDGNTVTWEPKFGENNRIEAVASAIPSGGSPLVWILIAAGVLIVLLVAFLLIRARRAQPATGAMDGTPTEPGMVRASSSAPGMVDAPPADRAPGSPVVPKTVEPPDDEEAPPPVPPVTG